MAYKRMDEDELGWRDIPTVAAWLVMVAGIAAYSAIVGRKRRSRSDERDRDAVPDEPHPSATNDPSH